MAVKSPPAPRTNGSAPRAPEDAISAIEAGERSALGAVRKFLGKLDDQIPGHGPEHSRVHHVVDAALEMSQQLVHVRSEFLRGIAGSSADGRRHTNAD